MNSMLSVYQTYHPESKEYVMAVKHFFKELSKAERKYAGVLVFAFKDDAIHPFFRKGDIVVGYEGKSIKNYDELKSARREKDGGVVEYLRLVDGNFEVLKNDLVESDIVGLLELTE